MIWQGRGTVQEEEGERRSWNQVEIANQTISVCAPTPKHSTHSTDLSLTFFSSPKKTFSTSCLDTVPRVPVWPDVPDLYCFHVNTAQLQT